VDELRTPAGILDIHSSASPRSFVVLWHGRGRNEKHVLRPLAQALQAEGHTVVVPDWDHGSVDRGAGALLGSLDVAASLASSGGGPLVLAGWSLGGTAALSVALRTPSRGRPVAVVGLAADTFVPSPLDGRVPLESVASGVGALPLHLLHGADDHVVDAEGAVRFQRSCEDAGLACELALIATDHGGVIGAEYDRDRCECVPSGRPAARSGLSAAVQMIGLAATG
jgi:alpha-beta hydrolase superfamily lysophospholipase